MKSALTLLVSILVVGTCLPAQAQNVKKKPVAKRQKQQIVPLTLASLEVGKSGYLVFPGLPVTLLPLKVESVDDGQFIGSLTSSTTGKRTSVIVRGVKTEGLVSGRFFQLNGELKVTGTEEISSGETVFVLEPSDPAVFALVKSSSPELERPR